MSAAGALDAVARSCHSLLRLLRDNLRDTLKFAFHGISLTLPAAHSYGLCDGPSSGEKWECGGSGSSLEPAAAPATVSGESSVTAPLGTRVLGRRRGVKTRKPGDLPSAVVTRDHVGRGAADMSRTISAMGCVGRLGSR
jgi:hypothetical protein